jgi:hypothetical protein
MFSFLFCLCLIVDLLDPEVTFREPAKPPSQVATQFYIPTINVWRFQFLQILFNTNNCIFYNTIEMW